MFQSAPHTFMRGDEDFYLESHQRICFNPRPTLSCGATWLGDGREVPIRVSIRAPHFHAGRPNGAPLFNPVFGVSIRAPHFHAGRRGFSRSLRSVCLFQSAPHTFMRGDSGPLRMFRRYRSFNPRPTLSCGATPIPSGFSMEHLVSIRAPHFHAGRRTMVIHMYKSLTVSIRAPHFHAGRRPMRPILATRPSGFNPRPTLSCGATPPPQALIQIPAVSIRAPHFHAGRRSL